jgi:hypothetical protein
MWLMRTGISVLLVANSLPEGIIFIFARLNAVRWSVLLDFAKQAHRSLDLVVSMAFPWTFGSLCDSPEGGGACGTKTALGH